MSNHASKGANRRFILPFATSGPDRLKEFTKNMEIASVLYLSEANREKGENHLLKKTEEKIVFLAEICYPIWLVPHHGRNLAFDGLGLVSHKILYDALPDIEVFNKGIRRKQVTTEAYVAALSRNIDFFRSFKGEEEIRIEGLIAAPGLKKDFETYFPCMKEVNKPFTTCVVLPPTIENHEIQAGVRQLSNLRKRISEDIENADTSMTLLNETADRRIRKIRNEIKKTQEKYHREIEKTESKSARKISQIQNEYNRKITKISRRCNRRLLTLNKNQARLKKTLRHLTTEAKRSEAKLRSSRRRNRKRAEAQWTLRLERLKKKLPTLHKEIGGNNRRIRAIESAHRLELAKQKIECLTRIESANKTARDLRGSREAEVMMKRQEIAMLENVTRHITKSVHETIQNKKASRAEFDRVMMPLGNRTRKLVYMPFYLVRYEKGEKKRYVSYPPSLVGDMGILTKMKGALGTAKVKSLLQSRSEAIATFLNQLPALFEKKPMVEKDVTEAGIRNSILLRKQLRIGARRGLRELEKENWISKTELQTISKVLYVYSASMNREAKTVLVEKNGELCLPSSVT